MALSVRDNNNGDGPSKDNNRYARLMFPEAAKAINDNRLTKNLTD